MTSSVVVRDFIEKFQKCSIVDEETVDLISQRIMFPMDVERIKKMDSLMCYKGIISHAY